MNASTAVWHCRTEVSKARGVPTSRVMLAGHHPPPFGGESVHVKQLAHFLREKGLDVEIFNLQRRALPSSEYRHVTGRLTLLYMLVRLPQRSMIFHLHVTAKAWQSWVWILVAGLAARLKRAPMILTVHSGLMPPYVRQFGKCRAATARWSLRSFTRIVCVNQEIARTMKDLGVDEARLRVIPAFLGVPEPKELATPDKRALRRLQPLLVVVAGGDPDPELGPAIVVHVLRELRETFPRLGAVLIGWGIGPKIAPLIRHLGLTDYAICLGEVSHDRCLALLKHGDVVVRSTFADGDAITVREALAFGVPVVASDVTLRPEGTIVFRTGDAADLQRKLLEVLSRRERQDKADEGRACPSAEQLWRLYCEVGGIDRAA